MNYAYLRVSTEEQNLENQKIAILEKFNIQKWIYEKKSGTIDYHKRNLGGLIKIMVKGDILVVTEISRLGRSLSMIFKLINECIEKGIRVVAIKNNFDFNPLNKSDIVSEVLLFAFGLSAEIERNLISERTKQGLEFARRNGKRIGRQKGEKVYNVKLRKYEYEIIEKYNNGRSINSLAKEYHVLWSTMKRFVTYYHKI
jgi:DNA invertase Pin-like site-specific DNA recombinase